VNGPAQARADYDAHRTDGRLGTAQTATEPPATVATRPAPILAHTRLPAAALAEVRRELTAVPAERSAPARSAPKGRTSPRRKTTTGRGRKAEGSPRRSAAQTREAAAQLRTERPDISRAEVARLLGISATRLRQVERATNGTEVPPT